MIANPTLVETLDALPLAPDVRARIEAEPDPAARGRMVNAVRRSPGLTVTELEFARQAPRRREPTKREKELIGDVLTWNRFPDADAARRWLTAELMKARRASYAPEFFNEFYYEFPALYADGQIDRRVRGTLIGVAAVDRLVLDTAHAIADWARATRARLDSFSLEQAVRAAARWHEEQAEKGEGHVYDPTDPSAVVFSWPDGWTLQELRSENDYTVEGNRMGHCVSSYFGDKERIFSLRDERNEPHVTIEADIDESSRRGVLAWRVRQIQGKGNREPIDAYKARLKSFFAVLKKRGVKVLGGDASSYFPADAFRRDAPDLDVGDDYGFDLDLSYFDPERQLDELDKASSRYPWYQSRDARDRIADLFARADSEKYKTRGEAENDDDSGLRRLQMKLDEAYDWAQENWSPADLGVDRDAFPRDDAGDEAFNEACDKAIEEALEYDHEGPFHAYSSMLDAYMPAAKAYGMKGAAPA